MPWDDMCDTMNKNNNKLRETCDDMIVNELYYTQFI